LIIVLVGSALGLLANVISPKRIPLITPPKKAPTPSEFMPLTQAHDVWSGGTAIFLDAREPADFAAGHIANALNLPVQEFPEFYPKLAPMLAPDSQIIVYCDGTECALSHRLADQLRQQGYGDVHILFNGWTAWRTAGYPTAQGEAQ
jgi:rhodanese-related sulfurtransferase